MTGMDPGLRSWHWAVGYATSDLREEGRPVDMLHDFYLPALQRACRYDRMAGYFSSSSLAAASRGFSRFVEQGGHARFIVGADLAQEDVEAILKGDRERARARLGAALDGADAWPIEVRRGVELLAWMVAHGHLQIRVALRVHGRERTPRPFGYYGDGYVHEKWAIFDDGHDQLLATGSLNESRTALELNAENIDVHTSWEGRGGERIASRQAAFDAMWADQHPNIRSFDLPEAVRQRLLRIADRVRHLVEVDGTGQEQVAPREAALTRPSPRERLQFALLRLAPLLPGGEFVGMESAPITPWPHQRFVARRLIDSYPDNHLLCDEVGLGKTIEAGLAFRSL